jgi:choice-of-anchor C domain-containing protein
VLQGWTVDSGEIDLIASSYWAPAEGAQSLDLNGVVAGSLSQLLHTTAGQTYEVSFALAANPCGSSVSVEVEAADERATFVFNPSGQSSSNMGWRSTRFAFRATGTSTRLSFRSLVGGSCGPALDNVQVAELSCPRP